MALARQALELAPGEREINGLTLSVSEEQLPLIKERIRRFRRSLNEEFGAAPNPDRVVQINLSLFPLTPKLQEETK